MLSTSMLPEDLTEQVDKTRGFDTPHTDGFSSRTLATVVLKTGSTSASNQAFFFIQNRFLGEGCGSTKYSGK